MNAIDNFFRNNVDGYQSGDNEQVPAVKIDVSADDDPFLGNPDAKVTVIEFSDYECPFCGRFWQETYKQIKKDYVDTNKIKFVYRDFPLNFHPLATPAAIAANCVREQTNDETYFKMHDAIFESQNLLSEDFLKQTAQSFEIDMKEYESCINDPAQKAEVEKDFADGASAGVSGTPSFFINGKLIVGAQPYSVIKAEIEAALNE